MSMGAPDTLRYRSIPLTRGSSAIPAARGFDLPGSESFATKRVAGVGVPSAAFHDGPSNDDRPTKPRIGKPEGDAARVAEVDTHSRRAADLQTSNQSEATP